MSGRPSSWTPDVPGWLPVRFKVWRIAFWNLVWWFIVTAVAFGSSLGERL